MERKIGEIFEYNGELYQCVEGTGCADCAFYEKPCNRNPLDETIGSCRYYRKDATSVIFKKLEKVGEPYEYFIPGRGIIMLQKYILQNPSYIWNDENGVFVMGCYNERVAIEIKQNKEDMEQEIEYFRDENNNTEHSNSEKIGEFLKPFDLEAAKAGKPVCTRDGRKARIICFDAKGDICPIIALIEDNGIDIVFRFNREGKNAYSDLDLMMLSEKKEGWVNVYRGQVYNSLEIAKKAVDYEDNYLKTIKINWEE